MIIRVAVAEAGPPVVVVDEFAGLLAGLVVGIGLSGLARFLGEPAHLRTSPIVALNSRPYRQCAVILRQTVVSRANR